MEKDIITKHMENKQTAMMDFAVHLRQMKNQLMKDYQNQRADYYVVRIFEGLELKALGFLGQEKEQIVNAHIHGDENHTFNSSKIEEYANDYYKETYEL
jgi:hypothetical protein